ncbi:MAG: HTH-type transcriptional repressor CarH [Rhodoferax sp.]
MPLNTLVSGQNPPPLVGQADVEQATDLSREVLRKWELRYGFPQPQRGARGQRLYAVADVHKLRLLARLQALGLRVGDLVALSEADLQRRLAVLASAPDTQALDAGVAALLQALAPNAPMDALGNALQRLMASLGLGGFVTHGLPQLNAAVGTAWAQGQLTVAAEHRYTQAVTTLLLRAMPGAGVQPLPPRVILTTPPGEAHTLGLLALQVELALQGAEVLALGVQTPLPDLVEMAQHTGSGVVAVSISVCMAPAAALSYLTALREALPPACALWAGGQGAWALGDAVPAGCEVFSTTSQAVARWRESAAQGFTERSKCS